MVYLRGTKFHYRFLKGGKSYYGPCPDCEVPEGASAKEIAALKKKAEAYEAETRGKLALVRTNKSVVALIENYKYELTGGKPIPLSAVPELVRQKPWKRKASESYWKQKDLYWNDFTAYMGKFHPEVKTLDAIRRVHCEGYVAYLSAHGRFIREVVQPGKKSYHISFTISGKTILEIVGVCKSFMEKLSEDAGIISNPWNNIVLPDKDETPREIFTPDELRKIGDGISEDRARMEAAYEGASIDYESWEQFAFFCRPLFLIASVTGLSESDICTLKWGEISFPDRLIRRVRNKTGNKMQIPVLPALSGYLSSLPSSSGYVLPEYAQMYKGNPSGVSYRVKGFLHGLGIKTVLEREGKKSVSVKDLHSMRHVFCYCAKRVGIPMSIVAQVVGHKTVAMTEHYASHDTADDLKMAIEKLPPILFGTEGGDVAKKKRLAGLAYTLSGPALDRVLGFIDSLSANDTGDDG